MKVFLLMAGYMMVVMLTMPVCAESPRDKKVLLEHKKLMMQEHIKDNKEERSETNGAGTDEEQKEKKSSNNENRSFFEWLQNLSPLMILLIVAMLALIFYFGLRRTAGVISWDKSGGPIRIKEPEEAEEKNIKDLSFGNAMELAKTGQLGGALIVLHKASLLKLQFNHMVPPGEHFTNNQVKGILKSKPETKNIQLPFHRLAEAAERKAFKGEEPGRETFNGLVTLYEENFLGMQGKHE